MKLNCLLFLSLINGISGACEDSLEVLVGASTKMAFSGFVPRIKRITNQGMGNKVVFKNFAKTPSVEIVDGVMQVSAGDSCEVEPEEPSLPPVEGPSDPMAAQCGEPFEVMVGESARLAFSGFVPSIKRITNQGMGNKIVFKNFAKVPKVEIVDGVMQVSAGDNCLGDGEPTEPIGDGESSAMARTLGLGFPLFLAATGVVSPVTAVAATAAGMLTTANAQDDLLNPGDLTAVDCDVPTIEVEIYVDTTVNELVMRDAQSGDYEVCPPESLYWKHHPAVFGGYEGCVGEKSYFPCPQDSQGVWEEGGELYAKYPLNFEDGECVQTGYTTENRTYWILWGDPLDKFELNMRTGLNPVVSFPFNRGPYPRYEQGTDIDMAIDDSSDARAAAKDLLVYIGAFTDTELEAFDVTMSEGAESGMVAIWAAKALEIAQTTCNRDIYALMEAPAYGYSPGDSADMVNKYADTFYAGEECLCFNATTNTSTCNEPTVTISNRGWLPLTPLPVEMGGDGNMYAADSTSPASPWFESMVFPENPSGKIKTPQLADPNRRVCDGVYVWPMYFGMRDYVIPMDERPDCSAWSFSITKAYSASVRAGFIIYKEEPVVNHDAHAEIMGDLYSMTHGLYSEWSWYGQMQLWEMIMSKPVDDPTSWIGAYSEIMDEKWDLIIDGFADCPVVEVTNPKAGAYVWFKYKEPYLGLQDGFVSSFFREVLGIRTTTYNWGFRGANPADFYGEGYGTYDFTRLQLYRDHSVYVEVSRRAKIICADIDASIGDFVSIKQWAGTAAFATRRRRNLREEGEAHTYESIEERKRDLKAAVPSLNDRQLDYMAKSHEDSEALDAGAELCAPDYSMNCLFKKVGMRFNDF